MGELAKATLFLIVAQALFVARMRVAPWLFAGESVLGAVALTSLGAGLLLAITSWSTLRAELSLKSLALAAAAAALGIVLHEALSLAARDQATAQAASIVRLIRWAAPLMTLGLVLLIRAEAPDRLRALSIVAGTIALFVLGTQEGSFPPSAMLAEDGEAFLLVLGSTAALGAFLIVGRHLVAASSPRFAATAVLTLGGAMAAALAKDGVSDAWRAALVSGERLLMTLAYLGLGTALAYTLVFAGLARLKVSTVAASFLLAAPLSFAYLLATGGLTVAPVAAAAAAIAVGAFALTLTRDSAA